MEDYDKEPRGISNMILSIGMIVKNESNNLPRCLEAFKPLMSRLTCELIIVDTGSSDDTVEIAKKYTDKVFLHKWNKDFSEARNITIEKSSGKWFLYVDADEVLESCDDLVEFLNSGEADKYESASIIIKNIVVEENTTNLPQFHALRLCRNRKDLKFTGIMHEQINFKNPVKHLNTGFIHYGYLTADEVLLEKKFNRNNQLLLKKLEANPNDYITHFQLAEVLFIHHDDQKALDEIEIAYQIIKKNNMSPIYVVYLYNLYINICSHFRFFIKAKELCQELLASKEQDISNFIDTYYYLALSHLNLGEHHEAIKCFNEYLRLCDSYREGSITVDCSTMIYTLNSFETAYMWLSQLYDHTGSYEKSIHYSLMIKDKNLLNNAINHIITIMIKYERYDELAKYYTELYKEHRNYELGLFIKSLEAKIKNKSSLKEKIYEVFSKLEDASAFSLLNKVRLADDIMREPLINNAFNLDIDFEIDPLADYLYYFLRSGFDISDKIDSFNTSLVEKCVGRLATCFEDYSLVVYNYFRNKGVSDKAYDSFLYIMILRNALILNKLSSEEYEYLFGLYLNIGIEYIEKIYNPDLLNNVSAGFLKNDEERFFLYMRSAFLSLDKGDSKNYIAFLRDAISSCPHMKRGIELLKDKFVDEISFSEKQSHDNELENYKNILKEKMICMLKEGKYDELLSLAEDYQRIIPFDLEVLYLKSEALLSNRM